LIYQSNHEATHFACWTLFLKQKPTFDDVGFCFIGVIFGWAVLPFSIEANMIIGGAAFMPAVRESLIGLEIGGRKCPPYLHDSTFLHDFTFNF